MWNLFNKNNKNLRQNVGGGKNSLEPPKNLPDLARDIYEHEQPQVASLNSSAQASREESAASVSSRPVEPSKEFVPQLDLSLIRQRVASQRIPQNYSNPTAISPHPQAVSQFSAQPVQALSQASPQQPYMDSSSSKPFIAQADAPATAFVYNPPSYNFSQYANPSYASLPPYSSAFQDNLAYADDSTGFFKEFEDYFRNNGPKNEIIEKLLDKDLLEHMTFYHTAKSDGMPFYASSAELSRAIRFKFEELQNLERNWVINTQKMDLLKKLKASLETDIHLKSEELKRLMSDSSRRVGNVNPNDFFRLIKPRVDDVPNVEHSSIQTYSTPVSSAQKQQNVAQGIISAPEQTQQRVPEHSERVKYYLNNYIAYDSPKYFYARNGQIFRSLADLMDGIEVMDKDTFSFHVNAGKNDFANWIKGVFGDFRLSDAIRPLNDQERLWYYLRDNTY